MRLTLLFIVIAVIALVTFMIVASINAGRVDVLAMVGIAPGDALVEVEYCNGYDAIDLVLGDKPEEAAKKPFSTYLLAGERDRRLLGRIEWALRHCREPRLQPCLLTGRALKVRSSSGLVRYFTTEPDDDRRIVWIEMAQVYSGTLYRLLDESNLGADRLGKRKWAVPKSNELASSYLWRPM
jgi:hypothetical protein